jgi:hypothetical protein
VCAENGNSATAKPKATAAVKSQMQADSTPQPESHIYGNVNPNTTTDVSPKKNQTPVEPLPRKEQKDEKDEKEEEQKRQKKEKAAKKEEKAGKKEKEEEKRKKKEEKEEKETDGSGEIPTKPVLAAKPVRKADETAAGNSVGHVYMNMEIDDKGAVAFSPSSDDVKGTICLSLH